MTPDFKAAIEAEAERRGVTPSQHCREALRAVTGTTAGREALEVLAVHADRADAERARRAEAAERPESCYSPVAPGAGWPSDPGIEAGEVEAGTLPPGDSGRIRQHLELAVEAEADMWPLRGPRQVLAARAESARLRRLRAWDSLWAPPGHRGARCGGGGPGR